MSSLEHYFENLLFHGKDINGDLNKNELSQEQQEAVETCYEYILNTIFYGDKDSLEEFVRKDYWEYT